MFFQPTTLQSQAVSDFLQAFKEHASGIEPFVGSNNTLLSYYTQQADNYPFLNYFIIANTSSEPISFCISSDIALPANNFLISSNGRRANQNIGLELVAPQNIPSFLLNSYFGELGSALTP
ncbi:hypothetical protein KKG31_06620 [Patescibacteria group bacterium]|nr:hypothetical protein [Patescibacteria group bacterium]MBU1758764.1 hypothetical protein [Patescibacteria group bacterium]